MTETLREQIEKILHTAITVDNNCREISKTDQLLALFRKALADTVNDSATHCAAYLDAAKAEGKREALKEVGEWLEKKDYQYSGWDIEALKSGKMPQEK